jgi:hypothetical protein
VFADKESGGSALPCISVSLHLMLTTQHKPPTGGRHCLDPKSGPPMAYAGAKGRRTAWLLTLNQMH